MRFVSMPLPEGRGQVRLSFPALREGDAEGEGRPFAVLSLRERGDMRYLESGKGEETRRKAFFGSLGLDPLRVAGAELFHTRRVLWHGAKGNRLFGPEPEAGSEGASREGSHDGLLASPGCGLDAVSVTVADCMPIWILDRSSGLFGVLHSGWKGTGILEVAVAAVLEVSGGRPGDLSVILGPAIGPCCYSVEEARARVFAAEFGGEAAPRVEGRWRLDLREANLSLARKLGIGSLLSVEACTSCDVRLGSFRREGASSFTRMVALAVRGRAGGA